MEDQFLVKSQDSQICKLGNSGNARK
jgi:hypothetical protein